MRKKSTPIKSLYYFKKLKSTLFEPFNLCDRLKKKREHVAISLDIIYKLVILHIFEKSTLNKTLPIKSFPSFMNYSFLLPTLIFSLLSCNAPEKKENHIAATDLYNKEFDWTITIPENFESVSNEQWKVMQNKGAEAFEKTHDEKIENNAKTLFVFKNDQFNYFESNYQPFDTIIDGKYAESFKAVNRLLYQTFETQMPDAKLDSASSQEVIDGLTFHKFKVNVIFPNQMTMDFSMYSRLFDNKEFTVNIMTADKKKEEVLLTAWRQSRFGKK
jgi:hypothetical protein